MFGNVFSRESGELETLEVLSIAVVRGVQDTKQHSLQPPCYNLLQRSSLLC